MYIGTCTHPGTLLHLDIVERFECHIFGRTTIYPLVCTLAINKRLPAHARAHVS